MKLTFQQFAMTTCIGFEWIRKVKSIFDHTGYTIAQIIQNPITQIYYT